MFFLSASQAGTKCKSFANLLGCNHTLHDWVIKMIRDFVICWFQMKINYLYILVFWYVENRRETNYLCFSKHKSCNHIEYLHFKNQKQRKSILAHEKKTSYMNGLTWKNMAMMTLVLCVVPLVSQYFLATVLVISKSSSHHVSMICKFKWL